MSGLYKSGDGNLYSDDSSNIAITNDDGTYNMTIAGTEVDTDKSLENLLDRQGLTIDEDKD